MVKIKYLIADSSAFINCVSLNDYAESVLTVPDVIDEIKNKRQIRRLCVLPYDLKVVQPSDESLQFVTNFAKKTGDYSSLSSIDLKVIALTHELETKHNSDKELRTEPIPSQIIVSKNKSDAMPNDVQPGFYARKSELAANEDETEESNEIQNDLINNLNEINLESAVEIEEKVESESNSDEESFECSENSDIDDHDDDNDDSWITPSNIKYLKNQHNGQTEITVPIVACLTADFAIQNVLKQINLDVCGLNGQIIKHLRTHILRCYSCFKVVSIMTKIFCPRCGNKTLKRVAVSLGEDGKQVIHINSKKPLTAKNKNKSLPRPKGGKHSKNPILVEDQPIPKQMPSRIAKTKTNALQEDYIAGFSPFAERDLTSKSCMLRCAGGIKEWARNNSYEENRRRKNCNKFIK